VTQKVPNKKPLLRLQVGPKGGVEEKGFNCENGPKFIFHFLLLFRSFPPFSRPTIVYFLLIIIYLLSREMFCPHENILLMLENVFGPFPLIIIRKSQRKQMVAFFPFKSRHRRMAWDVQRGRRWLQDALPAGRPPLKRPYGSLRHGPPTGHRRVGHDALS
jgi:hypothetical protein